ncbi:fumarylacetoacetate hydrolase family protein [Halalkalibacter wakoensis JCM 9140]|uniref:Fumarylacetoacetate hydrolase family protein n=1 Tax=Halalkalibacter wakoensis JCM 9140 TaxID=1236970 RepID=W4Q5X1_9BACI|nr:fumarylacetoacetate hydrolase family protein [Halalkalibacter wakoensis]GAE27387.1 fumarylacetoacetate hydrolase family protein [Halalkalibacter wakoensis JCM 9140]
MGIHVVRFEDNGTKWGVLEEGRVYPVEGSYLTLADFLKDGVSVAKEINKENIEGLDANQVTFLSPVTAPTQIVCQGANYSAHREEAGLQGQRPPFNLIFTKAASSITGPNNDILSPTHVKLLDYEIEVGIIIKQEILQPITVTPDNLAEYVAGFVITNDVSARDTQFTEGQWYKGKSFRTFCPVGPVLYLIDKDEAHYIHNLELSLSVNGEIRQAAHTEQLLFKPEETLTELSGLMSFYPGDLVLTGTPGGVALKLSPEDLDLLMNPFVKLDQKVEKLNESQASNTNYLKEGDLITCEVRSSDGRIDLGKQQNKVRFV